jgi:hypothetical protein
MGRRSRRSVPAGRAGGTPALPVGEKDRRWPPWVLPSFQDITLELVDADVNDHIHVISMRKAERHEQNLYFKNVEFHGS